MLLECLFLHPIRRHSAVARPRLSSFVHESFTLWKPISVRPGGHSPVGPHHRTSNDGGYCGGPADGALLPWGCDGAWRRSS